MSDTPFQIENNVPMPRPKNTLPDMPFDQMEVGDSFLIEGLAEEPDKEQAVRQRLYRYHKANWPVKFSLVRDAEVKGAMRLFRMPDKTGPQSANQSDDDDQNDE